MPIHLQSYFQDCVLLLHDVVSCDSYLAVNVEHDDLTKTFWTGLHSKLHIMINVLLLYFLLQMINIV